MLLGSIIASGTIGGYFLGDLIGGKPDGRADVKVINIYGEIKVGTLAKQIQVVTEADGDDTIIMNINSGGGRVSEAAKLVRALYFSKARLVIANIQQQASSAAFDIAAFSDRILVANISLSVLHLGSFEFANGKRIDLTTGMDTSRLYPADKLYLKAVIIFMKELTSKFMPSVDADKFLATSNTGFLGKDFVKKNPSMRGWRHDKVLFTKLMLTTALD